MEESRRLDDVHVAVFLTRKTSLQTWHELGILDRELAIYRRLIATGARVTLVTYGRRADRQIADELPGFTVLFNRFGLPRRWHEKLLPWMHREQLKTATVVKTNQTNGAEIALRAAKSMGVPLIARCGYMWSTTEARNHGQDSHQFRAARHVEDRVFLQADAVVVTTDAMAADLCHRYPAVASRVRTIPNYVDTTLFRPQNVDKKFDVIYVGRLSAEKNVDALLTAATRTNFRTLVVGGGESQPQWATRFPSKNILWRPRVSHAELPNLMNQSRVFALPSKYEGHPKALLEAMSCGCAVLGTNVPGIRDLVDHHDTGWLCQTSTQDIEAALQHLLGNATLRNDMGVNARRLIVNRFGIDRIAEMELQLYSEVQRHAQDTCPAAA